VDELHRCPIAAKAEDTMSQDGAEVSGKRPRKTAAMTIRMTQETRDALDAAARRQHRSASEIAENWLLLASAGEATYQERVGGSQIAEGVDALLDFARLIEKEVGNPRTFLPARDALIEGAKLIFDKFLPYTPDTPEGLNYRALRADLISAAIEALNIGDDSDDVEVMSYLYRAAAGDAHAEPTNLFANRPRPLFRELLSVVQSPGSGVRGLKEALKTAGDPPPALADAVGRIKATLPLFEHAQRAYMTPRAEAAKKGRALAETMGSIPPVAAPTNPFAAS
jgi:predicted transcriptional regulator